MQCVCALWWAWLLIGVLVGAVVVSYWYFFVQDRRTEWNTGTRIVERLRAYDRMGKFCIENGYEAEYSIDVSHSGTGQSLSITVSCSQPDSAIILQFGKTHRNFYAIDSVDLAIMDAKRFMTIMWKRVDLKESG